MRKGFRIYGWAWMVTIVATLLTAGVLMIHTSHHELAEDPNNLEKIVKVDLPDIAFVESEDNSDRGASRWDTFDHRGKFVCELSEETIMILDDLCRTDSLHWRKAQDRNVYSYYDEGGIDELYHVFCLIGHDGFTIDYEVEESEGILVLLAFAIAYYILLKWGAVLLVIALISRIKNRKKSKI